MPKALRLMNHCQIQKSVVNLMWICRLRLASIGNLSFEKIPTPGTTSNVSIGSPKKLIKASLLPWWWKLLLVCTHLEWSESWNVDANFDCPAFSTKRAVPVCQFKSEARWRVWLHKWIGSSVQRDASQDSWRISAWVYLGTVRLHWGDTWSMSKYIMI